MAKLFKVSSLRPEDKKGAKIIEHIINRPFFVEKVTAAMEEYVRQEILPEILYGTTRKNVETWLNDRKGSENV